MQFTKNIHTINLFYVVGYAMLLTGLTILCDQCTVVLKTENGIYDPLQQILAIDHLDDWRVSRFQLTLEQLYCIQLNKTYFDTENNRVKRDSLAALLQTLVKTDSSTTIFLDYDFEPLDTTDDKLLLGKDSLLYESMLALSQRLVIISDKSGKSIFNENAWTTRTYQHQRIPTTPRNGGIELEEFADEKKIRYCNLELENTKEASFVAELLELSTGKHLNQIYPKSLDAIEINYLIRNNRPSGKRPLFKGIMASTLVQQGWNAVSEKEETSTLIIIGAFHKLVNKYNMPFDYLDTPIDSLNGIYININTYVNVATNSFIRRSPWWLVFGVNFLLALVGSFYYPIVQQKRRQTFVKPSSWIQWELLLSGVFFALLIIGLFYEYYIKFPFVIPLLFFVSNQQIYHFFLNRIKKQYL